MAASSASRVRALYGYRGWAVVEAEQNPAKATLKVYAQKAFAYVSKLLFS
jgi:sugar phosphate isomerase/epimerase